MDAGLLAHIAEGSVSAWRRAITAHALRCKTGRDNQFEGVEMQGPYLQLNNGVAMPALGLGVFQSSAEDTTSSVRFALESGYRLIDTAAAYMNEEHVGKGMRQSGIDRSEVFVTTKAWINDFGYDRTLHAFDRSMRKLGMSLPITHNSLVNFYRFC
jgi:hypothetical protein